jgi:hypothetical protein
MLSRLKILCLAVLAMAAMSALAAPAQAAWYSASEYPFQMTGSSPKGSEALATEAGKVECDNHYISNTFNESVIAETVTFTPAFTGCSAFGFKEATVNTEGCVYVFHLTQEVAGAYLNHVDISCPTGKSIKVTAATCKMEIKGQSGLTSAKLTNASGTIDLDWELQGIAYTATQDGFLCPFSGTGNKTGGTYNGETTISRAGGGTVAIT